jgi:hypothetical protein
MDGEIRSKDLPDAIDTMQTNDRFTVDEAASNETKYATIESIRKGLAEATTSAKGLMNSAVKVFVNGITNIFDATDSYKILPSGLIDKSIGYTKCDFIFPAKNLFNKIECVNDAYVHDSDGIELPLSGYYCTPYIMIDENTQYVEISPAELFGAYWHFYDKNKIWISRLAVNSATFAFTSPANAVFFRRNLALSSSYINAIKDAYQLELGTTSTDYESFKYIIGSSDKNIPFRLYGNQLETITMTPRFIGQFGLDAFKRLCYSKDANNWERIINTKSTEYDILNLQKPLVLYPTGRDSTFPTTGFIQQGYWYVEADTWFDESTRFIQSFNFRSANTNPIRIALFTNVTTTPVKILETADIIPTIGVNTLSLADIVDPSTLTPGTKYYVSIGIAALPRCGVQREAGIGTEYLIDMNTLVAASYSDCCDAWIITFAPLSTVSPRLLSLEGKSTTFDLAAELATKDEVFVPSGTWTINTTIDVPNGKRIKGVPGKSILQASSSVFKVLDLTNKTDIIIDGVNVIGVGSNIDITDTSKINSQANVLAENGKGTKYGIYVSASDRITIKNCFISNFDYCGLYSEYTGNNWINGITLDNNCIQNCYIGLKCGTRTEYSHFTNNSINLNLIGMIIEGGNTSISTCTIDKNRVNAVMIAGSNDSHGDLSTCTLNHSGLIALLISGIANGFNIANTQIRGYLYLVSAGGGVAFSNCYLEQYVGITDGEGISITGCVFAPGLTVTLGGTTHVSLKANIYADGSSPAAINN